MDGFGGIGAGTDLSRHAHELMSLHNAVIGGSRTSLRPREVVARSWSRSLGAGLAPDGSNPRALLPLDEVERRRQRSSLREVIDDLGAVVAGVGDASQLMMVVTDADGIVLWRNGSSRVRRHADGLGFREGATWTESAVGTNAIGTALTESAPVQLFSGEHFEQSQHPWYCSAAPIHDPRTGQLLGVVDLSGPAMTLHPAVTALVATAARMAESQLWRRQEDRLERLRTASAPAVAGLSGPLLVVDEHGWVAHATGVAGTRRVAAPRIDRAVNVPGLGLCTPEPLGGGWLIRPLGGAERIRMRLDLNDTPSLVVTGGDSTWHSPLTARHAEILLRLHLSGPAGLSVTALSEALYGDAEHAVAVRAELSRLRRALGPVVDSRPYRLSRTVELTVDFGDVETPGDCAFVRSLRVET